MIPTPPPQPVRLVFNEDRRLDKDYTAFPLRPHLGSKVFWEFICFVRGNKEDILPLSPLFMEHLMEMTRGRGRGYVRSISGRGCSLFSERTELRNEPCALLMEETALQA